MSTSNTVLNKKLYADLTSTDIDNGHFIVPDGTMGDVGATWTISAWILRNNATYAASPMISLRTDGAPNEIIDISPNSSNELRVTLQDGTGFDQNLQVDLKDLPEVPVSTWEQLVVVYDASAVPTLPLYWNGFKLSDIVQSGNEGDPYQLNVSGGANEDPQLTNANKIIRLCGFTSTDHQMSMYNFCMWNTAFTDDEVRAIYNEGNPLFDPRVNQGDYQSKDNLRFYYNFQDPYSRGRNYGSLTTRVLLEEDPAATYVYTDDKPDPTTETVGGRNCTFIANGSNHALTSLIADATPDGFGDTFSMSLWFRWTATTVGGEFPRPMLMLTDLPSNRNIVNLLIGTGNNMSLALYDDAGTKFKQYISTGKTLNSWYHFVFTWNGTTLLWYENGSEVSGTTVTKFVDDAGSRVESNGYWLIGAVGSQEMRANLYQPALWNSVLSGSEVSALLANPNQDYKSNVGNYVSSANLVHYWPFRNDLFRGKDEAGDHHLTVNTVLPWDTAVLP